MVILKIHITGQLQSFLSRHVGNVINTKNGCKIAIGEKFYNKN